MLFRSKETEPIKRPYTKEGFEVFCETDLQPYFENRDGRYEVFVSILSHIRKIIREQQISGGVAGVYNASLTARINGLVEKREDVVKVEKLPDWLTQKLD